MRLDLDWADARGVSIKPVLFCSQALATLLLSGANSKDSAGNWINELSMQGLMLHTAVADAMLRLDSLIYGMGWVIASSGATIHNHNQVGMLGVG